MFNPYSIVKTMLVSEKSLAQKDAGKYVFEIDKKATKIDVAHAVEAIYSGVKVKSVNVLIRPGKPKRMGKRSPKQGYTSESKRAVVTLSEGTIEIV
ncbi:MAG: 50S ribosomal protein L23 [Lentisphaerota bacterium]